MKIDLVDSHAYPGLERKPGIQNWVDKAGGLPDYIERIAKHLHYEKGMSISRAIASAVNTVKRWARAGKVAKYGSKEHVSAKTVALATKAVAEWYAKRAAGKINLSEELLRLIDLTEVSEEYALHLAEELLDDQGDLIDLADAEISKADTMIALMIPPKVAKRIAVDGGVPPEDMHLTLTFHGETTQAQYDQICKDLAAWAADGGPGELTGHVGGLGQFPPNPDGGVPHFAPADVPGLSTLHEQVKAVTSKIAPVSEDHGYTPHMTLGYTKGDQAAPEPVAKTPVKFSSMHVVRGNVQRTEVPLVPDTSAESGTGAAKLKHGRLRSGTDQARKAQVNLTDLADRANRIDDPVLRATARQQVLDLAVSQVTAPEEPKNATLPVWALGLQGLLDLASTIAPQNAHGRVSDGRRSYKKQGHWKHGFIPVDQAAKESKAKGSPIRVKSLNRLFGSTNSTSKDKSDSFLKAAKGRAGQRTGGDKKINTDTVNITEGKEGAKGSTGGVAFVNAKTAQETNRSARKVGSKFKEASKQTRVPERARQNWDEIPAKLKTMRDGKRFVVAEFQGGQYITPWVGGVEGVSGASTDQRKVYATLGAQTASAMTTAQLRDVINNPRTPDRVKKVARQALRDKAKEPSRG